MSTTTMVIPCDICGDKGVIEAIITCCDCKTSRQHLYCMRIVTTEAPQFWLCEECERKKLFSPRKNDKEQIPEPSKPKVSNLIPKNTRVLKGPIKNAFPSRFNFKEKRVNTGRTKYLSCDEAVKLSSGSSKSEQPSRNAFNSKLKSSKSMPPPREKSLTKIYGDTKFDPQLQQFSVQKSSGVKDIDNFLTPKHRDIDNFLTPKNRGDAIESIKSTMSSRRDERADMESFSPRSEVVSHIKEEGIKRHIEVAKSFIKLKDCTKMAKSEVPPPTKEADVEVFKSPKEVETTKTEESTKMAKNVVSPPTKEVDMEVSESVKEVEKTITEESTEMAKNVVLPPTKEIDMEVSKSLEEVEKTKTQESTKLESDPTKEADMEVFKSPKEVGKTKTQESTEIEKREVSPPTKEANMEVSEPLKEMEKTNFQEEMSEKSTFIIEEADMEVPKSPTKVAKTNTHESKKLAKSVVSPPTNEETDMEGPKSLNKLEESKMKEGNKRSSEETNLTRDVPISELHYSAIPAFHSYWKGSLNLPNEHENLNTSFKAHPPSTVHNKVFETLNKMPENINFELIPIHQVWNDICQGYCPDKDDIGIYFFPRFKKGFINCTCLMEFLSSKNLVMKSYVDKVELLVLSSEVLQPDSQRFEGSYFLWGVFRSKGKSSKSIVVEESCGQRGEVEKTPPKIADFPPGFEKLPK